MRVRSRHRMAILPDWSSLVGATVARDATPVAIVNTTLVLRAASWSLVESVGKSREQILRKINAARREGIPRLTCLVVLCPGATLAGTGGGKAS